MHAVSRLVTISCLMAAVGMGLSSALAQSYPSKPIHLIVPFPPGGPVDSVGRIVGERVSKDLGQSIVIENRAGAGGIVGATAAAKAAPDGYTLFMCSIHHSVLPSLHSKLAYDIEKDFTPLIFGATFPIIVVAHPSAAVSSISELIARAKANPGKLTYASAGSGGGTHLAGELFKSLAGVDLVHIPYKGSAPAMNDVVAGHVSLMFSDAPTALPQLKAGTVKGLGVANPTRSALVPELPTVIEAGLPRYEAYSWAAFVAPAGTPKDILVRLNQSFAKVMETPDVRDRLLAIGAEPNPGTAEDFGNFLRSEIAKWSKVVKEADIRAG